MHRFFLPASAFQGKGVVFPQETAHQVVHVLRLKAGEEVAVMPRENPAGLEYVLVLEEVSSKQVRGKIRAETHPGTEADIHMTLYLGLTQREKFEWALQKCTEAGVAGFVPVISSRSLVQEVAGFERKAERWRRILQEAAEQCGRTRIPTLAAPLAFEKALLHARDGSTVCLVAWEKAAPAPLPVLPPGSSCALFIGPEGGFSEGEVGLAEAQGARTVSLGRRIYRMETAALAAAVLLLAVKS